MKLKAIIEYAESLLKKGICSGSNNSRKAWRIKILTSMAVALYHTDIADCNQLLQQAEKRISDEIFKDIGRQNIAKAYAHTGEYKHAIRVALDATHYNRAGILTLIAKISSSQNLPYAEMLLTVALQVCRELDVDYGA